MKYTTATLALLAGVVAAHDNPFGDSIPHCAVDCLTEAISAIGCTVEDPACACTPENQTALQTNPDFVTCLTSSCDPAEVAKAAEGGAALCAGAGGDGDATATADETSATETASETGDATEAPAPTGGSNSTATGTGGSPRPTPSGGSDSGSDDGEGGDQDQDGEGEDVPGSAAVPAIFGGAAIVAALFAL